MELRARPSFRWVYFFGRRTLLLRAAKSLSLHPSKYFSQKQYLLLFCGETFPSDYGFPFFFNSSISKVLPEIPGDLLKCCTDLEKGVKG